MRKLWPGPVVALLFVCLVALFNRGPLFEGLILGDYDAFVYFYPLRQYAAEALKQGHFPLWNPYLFLGAPFFANMQTAVLYPPNALFLLLSVPYAFTASVVLHLLLAGGAMYLFARRTLGVTLPPALLAALTFAFSGFLSNQVGHINQLNVSAWLPLLLVAFDEASRRRSLALSIATGMIASFQFLAGHTQEWYFSSATLGFFALWRVAVPAPKLSHAAEVGRLRSRLRPLAYLSMAGLVEAGVAAVQILPTLELSRLSLRGGGMPYWDVVSFSLPPTTALYTLLPTYPADLFSEYVGYVGVIPLVLAALSVFGWAVRPVTAFMVCLVGVGLFMALGGYNPLYPLLYEWVLGLDLFRVPARWLLIYTFGVSGLAALGAQLVLDLGRRPWLVGQRPRRIGRKRSITPVSPALLRFLAAVSTLGVGVVGLTLLYWVAIPRPDPTEVLTWGALAAVGLGLAALGLFGRLFAQTSILLMTLLVVVELWTAGANAAFRYPIPYEAYRPERTSTSFLLEDASKRGLPGRLLSLATDHYEVKETPDYKKQYVGLHAEALVKFMVDVKLSEALAPNIPLEYGIETVDGYDGGVLPLRRFAELKSLIIPYPGVPADNPLRTNLDYVPPARVLDLLNVRYVLGTKIQDAVIDNVYYDRGMSIVLDSPESVRLQRMPEQRSTSLGIISTTEGARGQKDGVTAAILELKDERGAVFQLPLRMGVETGETPEQDSESPPPAHVKPRAVLAWEAGGQPTEYFAKIRLPDRLWVKEISVKDLLPDAKVRIRAITLIDDVAAISVPLVLSDQFDRNLFFDMKLYTNRDPLPRAFMVHESLVRSDEAALSLLRQPSFQLRRSALLAPSTTARTVYRSESRGLSEVHVTSYRPEEVSVEATASSEGYLVLLDTFYPGWIAEVDGTRVPIERADYYFRGVFLEPGKHTVLFKYEPVSFQLGLSISVASLGLLSLLLLVLAVRSRRFRGAGVV